VSGRWKPAAEVAAVLLLQLLSQLGEEIGFTNQLSYDVVPASNTARFLIFSAVIVLAATTVIIATRGQLGRVKETAGTQAAPRQNSSLPPAKVLCRGCRRVGLGIQSETLMLFDFDTCGAYGSDRTLNWTC
jgi:hypothetical protein